MLVRGFLSLLLGCQTGGAGNGDGPCGGGCDSPNPPDDSAGLDTGDCVTSTWYRDADGDGFGDASATEESCLQPAGYTADASDCDDAHANAYSGAPERLTDGVDDDCDGAYAITNVAALPTWSVAGTEPDGVWFGVSLAMPGDLNEDGFDDLVVGTASGTGDGTQLAGAALVFNGPLTVEDAPLTLSDAQSVLYGGWYEAADVVCGAGDVDGDGFGDLVVGGPWDGEHQSTGVAYLTLGPFTGEIDLPSSARAFRGEHAGAYLGQCAAVGDVSGDGLADVVLSAPDLSASGSNYGAVYVLRGPGEQASVTEAETILRGTAFHEYLGTAIADLGDLNGDGQEELGVTNADQSGPDGLATYLVMDLPTGVFHPRDVGVTVQYDRSGGAGLAKTMLVSRIGDVTGDGYDDVAFGVDRSSQSNVLAILAGPFGGEPRIDLTTEYDIALVSNDGGLYTQLSFATGLGDWDGDGVGDLAVGNPDFTPEDIRDTYACSLEGIGCLYGAVFLKAGPIAPGAYDIEQEADRIEGAIEGGQMGGTLLGGSDLDGDGFPDLAVGAPYSTVDNESQAGIAYVAFGGGWP